MGRVDIDTEEQCINHCLEYPTCIAITLVSPNPGQYNSDIHGCHKKDGGWTVTKGTAKQANMVSVDMICVRIIRGKFAE